MTNPETQFKPGDERASAAGKKSKRRGLEDRMKEFLQEAVKEGDERTREDILREALFKFALKGNVKAISELLDRAFGKAKQTIDSHHTLEDNVMYQQLKAMTEKFREGE